MLKVKELRFDTTTLQYYIHIESVNSYNWIEVAYKDAVWLLSQSEQPVKGYAGPKGNEHNIYWTL